ncbi:fibronectin type III domain-containing protein [Leucobacter sp. HNU]|uniref:DUF7507 domain-containing protein n=1 Tax=Leucobacter sp. HNU TaxID=3236805 RepID=UPI003A7FBD35
MTLKRQRRRFRAAAGAVVMALLAVTIGTTTAAQAVVGDPAASTQPAGVTSVASTAGKAKGSGLWGYAGDVKTRSTGTVFSYGLDLSPADGSLWVTDSAKIQWTSNSFLCSLAGGTLMTASGPCYVGDSKLHRYALSSAPDWSLGQYQANGSYGAVAAGDNAGLGANYAKLADAQRLDGAAMPSGQFGGVRGVAVTDAGVAWTVDSDAGYAWLNHANHTLRMVNPDGSEAGALGKTTWPSGNTWSNRNDPEAFDYSVGVARMLNGDMVVTSQTPELLKQYKPDGTFVRNIYLNQPAGTAYPTDGGYRSPYAIAVDPADGTLLVGFIDPGNGNKTFIQRIDPNSCTTEAVGNPTGSSRDRCAVTQTIGLGTLATGDGQTNATFTIQVEPRTGDIYVGQRNGLISIFASDGTPKGKFSAFGQGNANGQVNQVRGIAFDDRGFMYLTVSEGTANTRVEIFARTPDAVTGLTGSYTDASKTSAQLTWNALPTGVTPDAQAPLRDFVVEQSTDGGTTWSVVTTPAGTGASATVTGLDPAKTYQFRVSAWNEAGNGNTAVTPLASPPSEISVVKTGNGVATPTAADAVHVAAGSNVAFSYTVTNEGASPVTGVTLSDSVLGTVAAPAGFSGTLAGGESVTFAATGPVAAGSYQNTATAKGVSEGQDVTASDTWFGFGVTTGIGVVKTGNGQTADTAADAVQVPAGADVTFNYTVTNTGNVPVTGLQLVDSKLGAVSTVVSPAGFTGTLAPGASAVYQATGPVAAGAYTNTVKATGTQNGSEVTASDDWFGFGVTTALSVVKTGGGVSTASASAPAHVAAGSDVDFAYRITNGGNVPMTIDSVVDSVLGTVQAPAGFSGVLGAGESVTFTATGPVAAGAYENTVDVRATAGSEALTASDDWFGFGVTSGLTVVKSGDGVTNDSAADAHAVAAGTAVDFTYTVTNTGNSTVSITGVDDDRIGAATPPAGFDGTLAPGAHAVFTGSGPVPAGDYHNSVTVAAATRSGGTLTATDDWFGFGVVSTLDVVKHGDGVRASTKAQARHVVAGSTVAFEYVITNRGNTPVRLGAVEDSVLGAITAPAGFDGLLKPGASVTYTGSGPVAKGAYRNTVEVSATETLLGAKLTGKDDWYGHGDAKVVPPSPKPTPKPPVDPGTPVDPKHPDELSTTGSSGAPWMVAVATAALLAAGGALLVLRRRRDRPAGE